MSSFEKRARRTLDQGHPHDQKGTARKIYCRKARRQHGTAELSCSSRRGGLGLGKGRRSSRWSKSFGALSPRAGHVLTRASRSFDVSSPASQPTVATSSCYCSLQHTRQCLWRWPPCTQRRTQPSALLLLQSHDRSRLDGSKHPRALPRTLLDRHPSQPLARGFHDLHNEPQGYGVPVSPP